jgi:hypothetical protein
MRQRDHRADLGQADTFAIEVRDQDDQSAARAQVFQTCDTTDFHGATPPLSATAILAADVRW